jgi:hypothetical protein
MRKIFQKWPLGGVLGLILLSVSVSTSCMQGKGQGQADAQTETAQVAKEQRSADGLRLMSMCHRRTKEPSPDGETSEKGKRIQEQNVMRDLTGIY